MTLASSRSMSFPLRLSRELSVIFFLLSQRENVIACEIPAAWTATSTPSSPSLCTGVCVENLLDRVAQVIRTTKKISQFSYPLDLERDLRPLWCVHKRLLVRVLCRLIPNKHGLLCVQMKGKKTFTLFVSFHLESFSPLEQTAPLSVGPRTAT